MIQDTLSQLEAKIARTEAVAPEQRTELLKLLSTLRAEIGRFAETHGEDAERIAGIASVSADRAMRNQSNPEAVKESLEGLSSSVSGFEESHPNLVKLVNRICEVLANLGI